MYIRRNDTQNNTKTQNIHDRKQKYKTKKPTFFYDRMTVHRNIFLVNKTNRRT